MMTTAVNAHGIEGLIPFTTNSDLFPSQMTKTVPKYHMSYTALQQQKQQQLAAAAAAAGTEEQKTSSRINLNKMAWVYYVSLAMPWNNIVCSKFVSFSPLVIIFLLSACFKYEYMFSPRGYCAARDFYCFWCVCVCVCVLFFLLPNFQ